jgi:rubrerythrin
MKKIIASLIGISLLTGHVLFAATTIENLKASYKLETIASAKFAAYAEQAKKEGLDQVAILITALAKSKAIHADNAKLVLEKMGQQVEEVKPEFVVQTTKENLADMIQFENNEVTGIYPGYVATAKSEAAADATKALRWTLDTTKDHGQYLKAALDAVNAKKLNTLPKLYYICPKCGSIYDQTRIEEECSFCGTKSSKYIKYQ